MLNKQELCRINLKTLFSHPWIKDSININFIPFDKIYKLDNDSNNEANDSDDYKPPRRSRELSESSNESTDNNEDDDDTLIGHFELGSDSQITKT